MPTLNRILNVLITLLAIAIVVVGTKLYSWRKELRERADLLAKTIQDSAQKLDPNSPEQISPRLTLEPNGEGTLGWKKYHRDTAEYKKPLEDFVVTSEKIRKQRDNLGIVIADIAKDFQMTDVNTATLNNPESYQGEVNKIKQHLDRYFRRANDLTKGLLETAQLIDPGFATSLKELEEPKAYQEAQEKVHQGINYLKNLNLRYYQTVTQIVNKLGHSRLGVTVDDIKEMSSATQMTLLKGIDGVNDDLQRLGVLQTRVQKLDEQIAKLKQDLEKVNSEKQNLQAQVDAKDKKIGDLQRQVDELRRQIQPETSVTGEIRYDGKVIKVNYDYNYVIISHNPTKDKLTYGVVLTVYRDREYIAKARVTKLFQDCAVADILAEDKIGEVMEGDRISWLQ